MITNTLCQLVIQTGFREPLEGRARMIAETVDSLAYEIVNPPEPEKSRRTRQSIYFVAAYLALC